MNCLACQAEMNFKLVNRLVPPHDQYYEVYCSNATCESFFAFATYPNRIINNYCLELEIDDSRYVVESLDYQDKESPLDNSFTCLEILVPPESEEKYERYNQILMLNYFTPLQDNPDYYVQLVRKLLKLKAFW